MLLRRWLAGGGGSGWRCRWMSNACAVPEFDLVVIGSGPAGQKCAINAAKLRKRVAVIDKGDMMGGVCVHTGTIPSKTFREAVLYLTGFRQRGFYGRDHVEREHIDFNDILHRVQKVEGWETEIILSQLRRNGVTVIRGMAQFEDEHHLQVEQDSSDPDSDFSRIAFKNALISVGTTPARHPDLDFDGHYILDADQILARRDWEIPKNLVVVGSGVIAMEYASMLNAVPGTRVTIVDKAPDVLGFVDSEVLDALKHSMRRQGATFRLAETIESCHVENDRVHLNLQSGKIVKGSALLYAVGRQGNTASLSLKSAGLEANQRGLICVNENFQTSQHSHIYAAGDVIGFPALASVAMEQGRIASNHMFGVPFSGHPDIFPYGIYTIPEISMVGKSETELTAASVPYETGIAKFDELAKGQMLGLSHGFLKIIFCPTSRRLLGVHAIGEAATEIIHIGQVVLTLGGTIDYFRDHVFNFPTFAEAYRVAVFDGLQKI